MWPLQWQRVREFKNMKHSTVLAAVAGCCCCSSDAMDVVMWSHSHCYWCSRSASYFGSSSSTWERTSDVDGDYFSYFLHNILYFIYFLLSQAVANGYASSSPPSILRPRSGTDGSAYKKTRSPYTCSTQHLRNLRSTPCFFFLFFLLLLLLCITHAHNSRNNTVQHTHVWIHNSYNGPVFRVASSVVCRSSSSTF